MRKLFSIDRKNYDPAGERLLRPSVRGIVIQDGRVAMIHGLRYDYYKFPGGGIEPGESHQQALIRECAEEAGLILIPESIREYGWVPRVEKGDFTEIFHQDNYYYLCQAQPERTQQHLDDYEAKEKFTPEFVLPQQAIATNRTPGHGPSDETISQRDARVLEMLVEEGYFSENP